MEVLISPDALGKQAQLTYEGKSYKLLLAYRNGTVLTQASLMSAWNAVKLSAGNGYAEVTGTIGSGSWNGGNARYELPQFTMAFPAGSVSRCSSFAADFGTAGEMKSGAVVKMPGIWVCPWKQYLPKSSKMCSILSGL